MRASSIISLVAAALVPSVLSQLGPTAPAGTHNDLNRWCGKAYEAGTPSFDPTGQTTPPPASSVPLLFVQVKPRYSIYLESETTGCFLVSATISRFFGDVYKSLDYGVPKMQKLRFTIHLEGSTTPLVINQVALNTTNNEFEFPLALLGKPQLEGYSVALTASTLDGAQTFSTMAEIFYLPEKSTGSVTKVDNLNGGLLFRGAKTNGAFEAVIPYGFYGDYGGYFSLNNSNVQTYFDKGFNVLHLVTSFLDDGPLVSTSEFFDEIGLKFVYDMRGSFMNLTQVAEQVALVKDYESFLMYYTGDEPDGWEYALNSTSITYNILASLDKYHPVSLVLNCQDFFFEDYSSGADIILQDTYPIGINPTFSIPFNTTCSLTHGDCGCDNCVGSLLDVPDRLDDLGQYQKFLGEWQKPLWSVLQAFDGEGYWQRLATSEETWTMALLSFNHGAKGITSWIYPSTDELNAAHGALASVVTTAPVLDFLAGAQPVPISVKGLDVSTWTVGNQVMVIVASTLDTDTTTTVLATLSASVAIPIAARSISSTPWGNITWTLKGGKLEASALSTKETSIVILNT